MDTNTYNDNRLSAASRAMPIVLLMTCIYLFLFIERPWETISYLKGIQIERYYALLLILVAFFNGKFVITSSPTNKWVYSLLALHFVLSPFAFKPNFAIDQGIEYAKLVVLYLLMLAVSDDEKNLEILIKAFALTMLLYVIHSLWEYSNGRREWRMGISRMLGVDETFGDPNSFGASLVLSLPIVFCLLKHETQRMMRRLYFGYFILVAVCIVLTGSRSSFVALFVTLLIWAMTQQGKRKMTMFAAAAVICAFTWSVMPAEKQDRIRTLWDEEAGPENAHSSAQGRIAGFKVSWKMFMQKPLTGVGAGGANFIGYRMANEIDVKGQESPTQAHNLYGEVLAEFGVGGALLLAGLVFSIWKCCSYARGHLPADSFLYSLSGAVTISLFLLLFFGLGGHNFYRPMWLWLAAWSGAVFRISRNTTVKTAPGI